MKLTNAEIQQKISKLPENIRNAINQFDWSGEVLAIGKSHNLQIDELNIFQKHTLEVIVGLTSASDYQGILQRELGIDTQTAEDIVIEANQRIFRELQKRAFTTEIDNEVEIDTTSVNYERNDPYREPLEHDGIKHVMRTEGIELLDHDEDMIVTTEVDTLEKPKSNYSEPQSAKPATNYREPIEEQDLKGVKQRTADMRILKTKNHITPDSAFNENTSIPSEQVIDQSLDKKLHGTIHTGTEHTIDLSHLGSEHQETGGERFLQQLSDAEIAEH